MTISLDEFLLASELISKIDFIEECIKEGVLGMCTISSSSIRLDEDKDRRVRWLSEDIFTEATEAIEKRLEDELSRAKLELSKIISDEAVS